MMDKLKSRISSGADISVDGRSGWGIHALFNAVIEIGFLLFVVLMIVNHASVNAPRLYAAAAAMAILVSAMAVGGSKAPAVGGSKTWSAGVYKAMTAFVFLLIYASARESGILIGLSENRAMAVSVAGITLCVVGVIFSAKLMTAGILGKRDRRRLLTVVSIAVTLCLIVLGLHFVLRRIYTMDSRIVLGVIHNVLESMLLFVVIMVHVSTRGMIKRFTLYAGAGIIAVAILKAL